MKYICLPGYSLKNLQELESISSTLQQNNCGVLEYRWRHWSNESEKWDPDFDVERIIEKIKGSSEVTIIAKSLGTYVAIKLADKLRNSIKGLVLMGIPINDLTDSEKSDYSKILNNLDAPLYLIHNRNDNHGSLIQVEELLKDIKYNLITKESDDHRYNYPEEVLNIIKLNTI